MIDLFPDAFICNIVNLIYFLSSLSIILYLAATAKSSDLSPTFRKPNSSSFLPTMTANPPHGVKFTFDPDLELDPTLDLGIDIDADEDILQIDYKIVSHQEAFYPSDPYPFVCTNVNITCLEFVRFIHGEC